MKIAAALISLRRSIRLPLALVLAVTLPGAPLPAASAESLAPPTTPAQALAALRTKPGLSIELATAEPLVVDPIIIEWGTDGRLWVVEMRDYPMGMDGKWKPGGVIKVLSDTDADGRYDRAAVFMSDVPFPTGVMPWKKGALICTAPDILYAEDTDGDGRADVVRKILTGFPTENYQSRVNGLSLGLDNWVYAANTMHGGSVRGLDAALQPVEVRGHDIRFQPDSGVVEAASGRTQFGRARDDWDNWFGCHNTNPLLHFPLREQYARRNPHVAAPGATVYLPNDLAQNRVYPLSQPVARFNFPSQLNYVTSGCGLGIYRDTLLGDDFYGNAFVCEPVHSVVTRLQLTPHGATFAARRADDEQTSEFLASTSVWFTPVQSRPGPDGALWVVDMVRPINEHPRWIPPERLAKLDVRAGADQGRLFRVVRKDAPLRPIRDLTKLALPDLVAALETPNGTARDLVHLELIFRDDASVVALLERVFRSSPTAAVRAQALSVIDHFKQISVAHLETALQDKHPGVRRFALRLSERFLGTPSPLDRHFDALVRDPDDTVRFQLALSLGEWHATDSAARLLGQLASADACDVWSRAAVVVSATKDPLAILKRVFATGSGSIAQGKLAADLIVTAVASAKTLDEILLAIAPPDDTAPGWRLIALAGLQDALDRRKLAFPVPRPGADAALAYAIARIQKAYAAAAPTVCDVTADPAIRQAALRLLTRGFNDFEANLPTLVSFLGDTSNSTLMATAIEMIRGSSSPRVPDILLDQWPRFTPSLRSTAVDILVSREDWTARLLSALESGAIPPSGIAATPRQRLLRHGDAALRARAEKLLASGSSQDRRKLVADYRTVSSLVGDSQRGAEIYNTTCAMCHVFAGESLGPTLAMFRNKNIDDFLEAILDPNAAVEPRYTGYLVATKDGGSLAGVIHSESAASLTLMLPGNIRQEVLRSEITSINAIDRSLMPEGLEGALPPQAMADLIAYVTASRESAASAPPW